jgi:hypothetical protein
MLMRAKIFVSALLLSLVTATAAMAAPVFSTGSFGYGMPNSTKSDVTTVTIIHNSGKGIVESVDGSFVGFLAPFDIFTLPNPTDFNSPASFNWTMSGIGNFVANTIIKGDVTSGTQATAIWYVYGTFKVGSDYANAGALLGTITTISMTQTGGPKKSISFSGTVYVPPPNSNIVPEPATLILLGSGALLLGFRSRRKRNA